ncbi:MAG: glycosyltransferase family 2 protein [Patescibacteria group bacterium]
MKLKSLTAFFLCFNDAKTIASLVKQAYKLLPAVSRDFEVMVVDDGSTDNSYKILQGLKTYYPRLKVIHHFQNQGYGAAIISGFKNASRDWVFYTDGDGQYDPSEIKLLVNKAAPGIDVVNGYKLKRQDNWLRRAAGQLYNQLLHFLYPLPIRDIDCDFRLIRKKFLRQISFTSKSGAFPLELILKLQKAGAKFAEVGIQHYPRRYGRSQFFRLPHLLKTLRDHLQFYWYWHYL